MDSSVNNKKKSWIAISVYVILWYGLGYALPLEIIRTHEMLFAVGLNAIFAALFVLLFAATLKEAWRSIKSWRHFFNWQVGLGWVCFAAVFIGTMFLAGVLSGGDTAANQDAVEVVVQEHLFILVFLLGGILVPFVEEMVYRYALRHIIPNNMAFIIISSLLFGLAHVTTGDWIFILPYAAGGAVLATVYVKTKNIWVVIVMHTLHNMVHLVWANF